jgi:PhnB protein
MRLHIYVNYRGTCESGFRFYEQHLGGRITGLVRHAEQPNPNVPADFANRFAMVRDKFGASWMLLHQPRTA